MIGDCLYLNTILEYIKWIEAYPQKGKKTFMVSTLILDRVIRNLEVIGEATEWLSGQVRQLYADIPWKQIAVMDDLLTHDYLGIKMNRVWQIVEQDLQILKATLTTLVQELES